MNSWLTTLLVVAAAPWSLWMASGSPESNSSLMARRISLLKEFRTVRPGHPGPVKGKNLTGGTGAAGKAGAVPGPKVKASLAVAQRLYEKVIWLFRQGRYAEAVKPAKRALNIRLNVLGPNHHQVAQSLNSLALVYYKMGAYARASPFLKRALAIWVMTLGPNHPNVATSLNNLAGLYYKMGSYAKALPLFKRALAIEQKARGPNHPSVATSLNNLAGLHYRMGSYAKALPLFRRALAIRQTALGPNHPSVATSLNNLAILYDSMGFYAKALPLFKRALTIEQKARGPNHPSVATSLNNLASLYNKMGSYAKALPLFRRALAIRETALGPNHPRVATSLNNLGGLYYKMGYYVKALPLFKRALAIREEALGHEHPLVAQSLNNLAGLHYKMGSYAKALPLFKRALTIEQKTRGPNHPSVATSLNNLAWLYYAMGSYAKALPLYKRSLDILSKALGPSHPHLATGLNNLAWLYYKMGSYAKALPLFKRALAIREKAFGTGHPLFAQSLTNLAILQASRGHFYKAHTLMVRAQKVVTELIDQVMGFSSDDQKLKFMATQRANLVAFISLAIQHFNQKDKVLRDAVNVWLRRKGIILETQRSFQEALVHDDNPEARKTLHQLAAVRSRLARLTFSGPGKMELRVYRQKLAQLKARKDTYEAKLSRLSRSYNLGRKVARVDVKQVTRALPANSVLVEWIKLRFFDYKARGSQPRWLPAHYLAMILSAGSGDKVVLVDLGEARHIDQAVVKFRRALSSGGRPKSVAWASRRLHQLVFAPIVRHLGKAKTIFISPDGNLNFIPFEVILAPDGRYLIQDYTFNYLPAGRDLLRFGRLKAKATVPVIMGAPDFSLGVPERKALEARQSLKKKVVLTSTRRSADLKKSMFKPLPGSRSEVKAVARIFEKRRMKVKLYTDKRALKTVLMGMRSPSVLHIATHGFFLADQDVSHLVRKGGRGLSFGGTTRFGRMAAFTVPRVKIENPLLRSGLVLAGANNDKAAGVLTAEEILGLRLEGTDLVVLSACDTGLGEVKRGEGVYGLRRAFMQAGAKSLVMSLWKVPDRETMELMFEFYTNMLRRGLNRSQALRKAALTMMARVMKRYGQTNPYYWGGFVFVGEP